MALKALYRKYFQKSKIFIYPLLDIKRGVQFVPIETYLSWNNLYNTEDKKLICVYNTNEKGYDAFEANVLLKHTRLCDMQDIGSNKRVFVFDFSDLNTDWDNMIIGQYSKISEATKRKIVNFFDKNSGNHMYVSSYMFPEKFFNEYAKLLDVPVKLLKETGELCDKPDFKKEKLIAKIVDLDNIKKSQLSL